MRKLPLWLPLKHFHHDNSHDTGTTDIAFRDGEGLTDAGKARCAPAVVVVEGAGMGAPKSGVVSEIEQGRLA